jgi:hypothetical protein
MRAFPLLFGAVRHMRLIGEDQRHKALRARNEQRLAALKAANRLYEDKRERTSDITSADTGNNAFITQLGARNAYNDPGFNPYVARDGYTPIAFAQYFGLSSTDVRADSQR